jgi:DNA-binding winged helix-turn-helix (wHTH) protein/tetratricopeptide (TPR) repeat protein
LPEKEIYEFGAFRLDVSEHSLSANGKAVPLKPKVFETLVLLVRNAGHLLSKQELMSRLWPDAVVDETNLNRNVWLIRRALGGSGDSSECIETVPRVGYRFVGSVRRIETAHAPPAIEAPPSTPPAGAPAPQFAEVVETTEPARQGRTRRGAVAVAAALLAVLVGAALAWRSAARAKTPASESSRRTISVLGFRNLSGRPELDWIGTALSEMVQAELAPGATYRLMPAESAEHLRRDLALDSPSGLSPESLVRLRGLAPIDAVIGGSYVAAGPDRRNPSIRIDVEVQDARNGETLSSITETGEASKLFDLVSSVGSRLRLALREPTPDATLPSARASLPRDPRALRLYAEGLQKLRASDTLVARDLLAEAVADEPTFPLSHSALGKAYAALGYEEKARLELQQAFENSGGLPRQERLEVESAYLSANKEWDKAIAIHEEIDRLSPDDLENGLRLAGTLISASRPAEAMQVVKRLHRLPPPAGSDPRIDLLEWSVVMQTDPKAALAAAERGLAESRARRQPLLEANALLDRATALQTLGTLDKAPAEQALEILTKAADLGGESRAAHKLGDIQFDQGDIAGAAASYRRAISAADRIGYVMQKAAAVASLSRVATIQGDTDEAEKLVVEANSIWRAIPDRRQLPWGLNALGNIRLGQGKLDEAESLHREALKMCRDSGDHGSYLHDGYSGLFAALAAQGKLDEAASTAHEALNLARQRNDPSWTTQHSAELGQLAFERGRFADADRMLSDALSGRQKIQEYTVPDSELLVARLRFEEGNAEEAGRLAKSASKAFEAAGRRSDQAAAEAALAEAFLVRGRREDAEKSVEATRGLVDDKTPPETRIPVLLARVRVEEASGRIDAARSDLAVADLVARRTAWRNLVFEARLAAAEVDARSRAGSAPAEAARLATDARAMGFERIARRAEKLEGGAKR